MQDTRHNFATTKYLNAIENMDFIKPRNKHSVIDYLNVYSIMNTPSNTKYMYVQCNEYSL